MTEQQTEQFLEQADAAYQIFKSKHPQFVECEATMREMALRLQSQGLDPRTPEHLSAVYLQTHTAPVAPPADTASSDTIEAEASRMIASGEVSVASVRGLSAEEFALKIRNMAFVRAIERLPKPPRQPILTRGDTVMRAGVEEHAAKNGLVAPTWNDPVLYNRPAPPRVASQQSPRGFTKAADHMPLPKQVNVREALKQERADHEFIDAAREKTARALRVKAHRAKR